jgi:hypothetical protein
MSPFMFDVHHTFISVCETVKVYNFQYQFYMLGFIKKCSFGCLTTVVRLSVNRFRVKSFDY